jgi:hypothetical protein
MVWWLLKRHKRRERYRGGGGEGQEGGQEAGSRQEAHPGYVIWLVLFWEITVRPVQSADKVDEERAIGNVKWQTYKLYIVAATYATWVATLVVLGEYRLPELDLSLTLADRQYWVRYLKSASGTG